MADILELTFSTGANQIERIQWELLDTPPARAWRELLEESYKDHDDYELDDTEATFCLKDTEAVDYLYQLKGKLKELGIQRDDLNIYDHFGLTEFLGELFQLFRLEQDSWDRNVLLSDCIDLLKPVLWYARSVGTGKGQIYHHPQVICTYDFKDSWYDYMTMETNEGDLYAELIYESAPWHQIGLCENMDAMSDFVTQPNVGQVNFMTSAFSAHWHPDMRKLKRSLDQLLDFYDMSLRASVPEYDAHEAHRRSGRLPVAKLLTDVPYETLKTLKKIRKVEILGSDN